MNCIIHNNQLTDLKGKAITPDENGKVKFIDEGITRVFVYEKLIEYLIRTGEIKGKSKHGLHRRKMVACSETGIEVSVIEAAKISGYNYSHMSEMINGKKPNNSTFKAV